MSVQYQTKVDWDVTLIDLEFTDADTAPTAMQGLVKYAVKITTGAPTATAGKFIEAAMVANAVDSNAYLNTGTTASPVWTLLDVAGAGGITELTGDVTAGPGNGSQTATVAAIDLETATVTGIADTEIMIGTGAGTAAFAAMSGNATMDNTGAVTVTGAAGLFEAGGGITNAGGTLYVPFVPVSSLPQALSGPGAADITSYQTQFTSTGAGDAITLAVSTRIGQEKKITYVAEGGGADTGVITPAAVIGYATVTLNAIGDYVVFFWTGAAWAIKDYYGATVA